MRRYLVVTVFAAAAVCASASSAPMSPMPGMMPPPSPPPKDAEDTAVAVTSVGDCSQKCWNESAASADCDPNTDDDCLCGSFFDAVTACTSATCSTGDNLEVLNTLEPLCA
ncbi:hypothetical protein BU23DRAFT_562601 [Bimuria novae-zelandiae CBS 107.79]|uniref:CFEM domain-containing protein n=1 Tax=Bimuria novae-zelandiae CBS 107.79 TaxID=1447943 RepID=A0A6A5VSH2_9PLEO|nr:hypothetical protein BU23DRAFT_562601 [Bimuria novae-zelandiae CBS 107.79]